MTLPIRTSHFGPAYDFTGLIDAGSTALLVATLGYQAQPQRVMLPHQLYIATAHRLLREHPASSKLLVCGIRPAWVELDRTQVDADHIASVAISAVSDPFGVCHDEELP